MSRAVGIWRANGRAVAEVLLLAVFAVMFRGGLENYVQDPLGPVVVAGLAWLVIATRGRVPAARGETVLGPRETLAAGLLATVAVVPRWDSVVLVAGVSLACAVSVLAWLTSDPPHRQEVVQPPRTERVAAALRVLGLGLVIVAASVLVVEALAGK